MPDIAPVYEVRSRGDRSKAKWRGARGRGETRWRGPDRARRRRRYRGAGRESAAATRPARPREPPAPVASKARKECRTGRTSPSPNLHSPNAGGSCRSTPGPNILQYAPAVGPVPDLLRGAVQAERLDNGGIRRQAPISFDDGVE